MTKQWPNMPLICNEVHDNLVFDMPVFCREVAIGLIKECMESATTLKGLLPGFNAPLKVDTKLGPTWGHE
jgi:DNA polymerase I-like protein with 3'-5' exonuclease and polymerase domains